MRRVLLFSLEHFLENFSLEHHRKPSFHKCASTYRLIFHNCAIWLTKKKPAATSKRFVSKFPQAVDTGSALSRRT